MKKITSSLLALMMCAFVFPVSSLAASVPEETLDTKGIVVSESNVPQTAYAIPLCGVISDADGTVIEVIGEGSDIISPHWAPVATTFTLNAGQKFTSYQYAGSAYDWIGGEIRTFSKGSSVNLKVQKATSVGGSRTTALNTTLRGDGAADGVSLSTSQYGNIIYTNNTNSTISFYGYVIVNDR